MECHKVTEQSVEITVHIEELLDKSDVSDLFCKCCVLSDKSKKCIFPVLRQEFIHLVKSQTLYRSTSLGSLPRSISGNLGADCRPIIFGKNLDCRIYSK